MDNQQAYWENYTSYWLKRVGDSNHKTQRGDHTPDDQVMLKYINLLSQKIQSCKAEMGGGDIKVLDYGCGFGRAYPFFQQNNIKYYGCDIAQSCIDLCIKNYPSIEVKKLLQNGEIPYENNYFDGIFCYGVFDACSQNFTLLEMLKKLNNDGILLLTGKNIKYFNDDSDALYAEEKARENGHPNFFTDTLLMLEELKNRNFEILETRFFKRRKDNSTDTYISEECNRFYTFAILIKKTKNSILRPFENFSYKYSTTFKEKCE